MTEQASDQNPIDRVADDFIRRYRRGERPSLTEYAEQYPDLAQEIRELFPALVVMERLGPQPEDLRRAAELVVPDQKTPDQLGEYRILREVGRGGMGIVYEAEQVSLGRHVALKVLPLHAVMDSHHLSRFQQEARAAARLHHTNIVPVFGVGEQQGIHFYAMQFIQGQGLDQVLDEVRRMRHAEHPSGAPGQSGSEAVQLASQVASGLISGEFRSVAARPDSERPAELEHKPAAHVRDAAEEVIANQALDPQPHPLRPAEDASIDVSNSGSRGKLNELAQEKCASALDLSASYPSLAARAVKSSGSSGSSAYFQSVARMGAQVADALAYAHSQGVLHRDIKPSNLLLDTQGNVWVTDFGLAKQTPPASTGESPGGDLTHTGDVVGTLRYMAPERFSGRSDAQSDIYGLGATLYEMLTLRPVFPTADRARLIRQITHEEPPRPRRLDRQIPADLETIVLKAIEKDPANRYQGAGEIGDDLRRFLAYLPIQARRTPSLVRLGRWCRRNPPLAALATALFVSFIAGFAGVLWQWLRAEENLRETARQKTLAEANLAEAQHQGARAAANLAEADRQRQLAEANLTEAKRQTQRARTSYELARQAVDDLIATTNEDSSAESWRLGPMRTRLLQVALAHHEGLIALSAEDPQGQADLASSYLRIAMLHYSLDANPQATDACEKAVELLDRLTREHPHEASFRAQLGKCLNSLGQFQAVGHTARADASLNRAILIWTKLAEEQPTEPDFQNGLAGAYNNLGFLRSITGNLLEAIKLHEQSLAIREKLVAAHPENRIFRKSRITTLSNLARRTTQARQFEASIAHRERCLKFIEELLQEEPQSLELQTELAANINALADTHRANRRLPDWFDRAMGAYRQALDIQLRLVQENPGHLRLKLYLANTYENMAISCQLHGDHEQSLALIDRAIGLREGIMRPYAEAFQVKAYLLTELGRPDEALVEVTRAIHEFRAAAQGSPDSDRHSLSNCYGLLARLQRGAGQIDEAVQTAQERRSLWAGQPAQLVAVAQDLAATAAAITDEMALESLEHQLVRRRSADLALDVLREAKVAGWTDWLRLRRDQQLLPVWHYGSFTELPAELAFGFDIRARRNISKEAYPDVILDLTRLLEVEPRNPVAMLALGRIYTNGPSDIRHPQKAIEYSQKAVELRPSHWSSLVTLGAARYRAGELTEAVATFELARPLNQDRYSPFELLFLAMSYHRLNKPDRAREALAEAVELIEHEKQPHWFLPNEIERLREEAEALLKEN